MSKVRLILLIILAGAFGLAFTFFFMSNLFSEASIYTDFTKAESLNKKVHVVGKWTRRDDYFYDSQRDVLDFWMADSLQREVKVRFHDPMPANFESAEKIVVIGKMEDGHFEADHIQMKCPSKYNKEEIEDPSQPNLSN